MKSDIYRTYKSIIIIISWAIVKYEYDYIISTWYFIWLMFDYHHITSTALSWLNSSTYRLIMEVQASVLVKSLTRKWFHLTYKPKYILINMILMLNIYLRVFRYLEQLYIVARVFLQRRNISLIKQLEHNHNQHHHHRHHHLHHPSTM